MSDGAPRRRILPPHRPDRRAETLVLALLGVAAAASVAFIVVYAAGADTQGLGLCIGIALGALAIAAIVAGKRLVPGGLVEEPRPGLGDEAADEEIVQLVEEAGEGISRRRLLLAAAGGAGACLGAALVTPVVSLGPVGDTGQLRRIPWDAGVRLVDEEGAPIAAARVPVKGFLTGFPEGADRRELGSPLIVIRVPPERIDPSSERAAWAPEGIMAFSKICTHAGCAIALFRAPKFPEREPGFAVVCPCHYSTFDVLDEGKVLFGPAGRPLPQLPLRIGADGVLQAAGPMSGGVGPSWLNVRR